MNYCSECGKPVVLRIPEGDNLPRYVCDHCDMIHYQNPRIVAGCIPVWKDKVLLCRRAIEPRHGLWTLPAGFMENQETMEQAAMRESMEEANANVELQGLFALFSLPHINQVYVMYRAQLLDQNFRPGLESLEVELFTEQEIPWDTLAFRTIHHTLTFFFEDRQHGKFNLHTRDLYADNRSTIPSVINH